MLIVQEYPEIDLIPDDMPSDPFLLVTSLQILWYHKLSAVSIFPIYRRCIMKVQQAVDFHLQYHKANSKKKYCQNL